jgi:hypothetical protein
MQAGIVEGAAAASARLVSSENVYVYGQVDGPMREDTPWNPCSRKGAIRVGMNQALLDADEAGKVRVALARAPDYYGPAATATTVYGERVFWPALKGKAAQVFGCETASCTRRKLRKRNCSSKRSDNADGSRTSSGLQKSSATRSSPSPTPRSAPSSLRPSIYFMPSLISR